MESDPWRKQNIIQAIAALDIVVATFSIFYNGKTLLVIFDGLHLDGEEKNWPFVFLILSITFGIQTLHIVLAMFLLKSSSEDYSTLTNSIRIIKVWQVASISFLFLLVAEFYVGLRTFEYNNYILVFIFFVLAKGVWRVFTILYVQRFRRDLEFGLNLGHTQDNLERLSPVVFRMILTSPENCDVDVSEHEGSQTPEPSPINTSRKVEDSKHF